jgi:Kelch motif/Galactose oxidase, central domain
VRAVALLLLCGCGRYGFDPDFDAAPATALHVSISAATGVSVAALEAQLAFASLDPNALYAIPAAGGMPSLPTEVVLALPNASGSLTITLDAVDVIGRELGAAATTQIAADQQQTVALVIGGELSAACTDGVLDGDETDVDCGGSCPACGVGETCSGPSSCVTGVCDAAVCELASGPPSWVPIASMPLARIGAGAALGSDGRVYVYGGAMLDQAMPFTEVDAYDAASDTWSAAPALSSPVDRMGYGTTGDGEIYSIAGNYFADPVATVQSFLPGAAQWLTAPPLPAVRGSLASAVDAHGTIYAIGGDTGSATTDELDAFSGAWTTRAPMPTSRTNLAAARASDGTLVAVGGHDEGGVAHYATAEAYDPSGDTWAELPAMSVARSDLAAATGADGRVYAVGGYDGAVASADVEAYRAGAPAWIELPPLSVGRDTCMATTAADGRVLVFGGKLPTPASGAYATAEAYGPSIALAQAAGATGDSVTISGSNFAANATVQLSFDAVPVELVATGADGSFAGVAVAVPALAAGLHAVHAIDDRSQYPVSQPFTIE